MTEKLKHLYKELIENRKANHQRWHDDYKNLCEKIDSIRSGKFPAWKNEKGFLRELLQQKSNGISTRGQSILSEVRFEKFIKDSVFMSLLETFINVPSKENFEAFRKNWFDDSGRKNHLLVNRVAVACTRDVCTTVSDVKFNFVFKWLLAEKLIEPYSGGNDWFSKNEFLMGQLKTIIVQKEPDPYYLSIFVWELYEHRSSPFHLKKQIVKYGVPGTGKTYLAKYDAKKCFEIWKDEFAPGGAFKFEEYIELIQFHPSYSYEDFIEGLRPVLKNGVAQLTLQNGHFKEFCRKAGKWEIDVYQCVPSLVEKWEELTIKELAPHKEKLSQKDHWKHIFADDKDQEEKVSKAVPPFFFIIDEINRTELSRVLGELMYCLEYRGIEGKIKTQYANLNDESTGMLATSQGYEFFIPNNVYLIGTMNTTDRSIESFDFALRRRFLWQETEPNISILSAHLNKKWQPLAGNLEALNEKIKQEPLLGKDYQIGHAYLMNMKYDPNLSIDEVREQIWKDAFEPLLQEYLRGTGKSELIESFEKVFK